MDQSLPPLNALRAFESAARTGSFVSAGREMNVSPSAVSRLVKVLEGRLNVQLFQRRANGLDLTATGTAYLKEVSSGLERIRTATRELTHKEDSVLLIGAGPTLAMRWLIPRLPQFQSRYPGVEVRLSTSIEDADPMKPDWSAAIRIGDGKWEGFDAEFLFTADMFPVCSPALAKKLKRPGDLARVKLLQVARSPEDWPLWLEAAKVGPVSLSHALVFDYPAFALSAALDGLGVAMARAPFVADDLAAGRLVRPFRLSVPKGKGWYLVSRPAQRRSETLTCLRKWLRSMAKGQSASA